LTSAVNFTVKYVYEPYITYPNAEGLWGTWTFSEASGCSVKIVVVVVAAAAQNSPTHDLWALDGHMGLSLVEAVQSADCGRGTWASFL
jgi:hypothetical protein